MKHFFDILITLGLVATLAPAAILFFHAHRRQESWEHNHRKTTRVLIAILLFGTTCLLYGSFVEPRLLVTNEHTVHISGMTEPITIALVADFQIGTYQQSAHLERVVDRILSLHPDLVAIAGDQVDNATMDEDETIYLAPLRRLVDAGIPTYAVHGNHEYGVGGGKGIDDARYRVGDVSSHVREVMEDYGIQYLVNEVATATIRTQTIRLFGGDSYWAKKLSFDTLEKSDLPTIALIHNPAAAWIAGKEDIDLILSGHTHGGQIRFPFIGPLGRVDDVIPAAWYQGLHDVDEDTQIFVTSGTGETGTRARLFNPPEVALLTIQ